MAHAENRTMAVDRILEIGSAVDLVGDVKYLDGVTAFKTGMLGDYAKPIVKNYVKERDKILADSRKKIKLINDSIKQNGSEENKLKCQQEAADISEETQEKLNELNVQTVEIKIPHLKLSDFIAKSDISETFVTKEGTPELKVVVKAGQGLVPVKFFTLMGDVIVDDKS